MLTRQLLMQTAGLAGLLTLSFGGCTITVDPTDLDLGDNNSPAGVVTIRIINSTGHTLDPQIYIAAEPVDLEHLFTRSRKYTNYGVGQLGLIARNTSDDFEIECDQIRLIGTLGGSFGGGEDNNDLNNPAGSGTQRVLTQELVFDCGERITFTYRRITGGFRTDADVDS
jgi:hypothetical protein